MSCLGLQPKPPFPSKHVSQAWGAVDSGSVKNERLSILSYILPPRRF